MDMIHESSNSHILLHLLLYYIRVDRSTHIIIAYPKNASYYLNHCLDVNNILIRVHEKHNI